MSIFIGFYKKGGVRGKKINQGLKQLSGIINQSKRSDGWHCKLDVNENPYEYVARVSERHPREEIVFRFSRHGVQLGIKIFPLNPELNYHELGFSIHRYNDNCKAGWEEIPTNINQIESEYEKLCWMIVYELFIFLGFIKQ